MGATVIGDAFVDIILPLENWKRGETYHRYISTRAGGVATVAIQISRLGEEAKFVGKLGNDAFGYYLKKVLRENTVKDLTFIDDNLRTGLCISLVYNSLTFKDLESILDEIENSKIVYFSGYSLVNIKLRENILKLMRALRKEFHKKGEKPEVFFNPGAPNIITQEFTNIVRKYVDVLILNWDEVKRLTGKEDFNQISSFLSNITKIAVITRGAEGCTIVANRANINVETDEIEAKDTTGAGDAFSAGFIVGRLRDKSLEYCGKLGNEVAKNFIKNSL
jgi:sugar/nucleoside kinase (ribokinase family)